MKGLIMLKAFEIVPTESELDPDDSMTCDLVSLVRSRTVIVRTSEHFGQAVIVAGRIVTSLFLVRNEKMVKIFMPTNDEYHAVVARRDESNNIALLQPMSLESGGRSSIPHFKGELINTGVIGGISDPLIMADSRTGKPKAVVTGMSLVLKVCPRKEEQMWRFERDIPDGIVGGGVWKMNGLFTGLSLVTKDSLLKSSSDYRAHLYALPAETILEFIESN